MDIFSAYIAMMASAAVGFFGSALLLKLLEKKRPGKREHPPETTNQDR